MGKVYLTPLVLSVFISAIVAGAGGLRSYKVQRGDNLTLISKKTGVSVQELVRLNSITNPNRLLVGQKLLLSSPNGVYSGGVKTVEKEIPSLRLVKPVDHWYIRVGYRSYGENTNYGLLCEIKPGTAIRAANRGTVAKIGYLYGYGKYILIDHGNGWHTLYSNIKKSMVSAGEIVESGATIAVGEGDSFFFSLAYKGKPVNPLGYLENN